MGYQDGMGRRIQVRGDTAGMKTRRFSGIFSQIWTGFAAICIFVVLLAGCICFFMMRKYAVENSIGDLSAKAWTVSQIASEPAGITRLLNHEKIYELQQLTDSQIIYVDLDMNARLLSVADDYAMPEKYRTEIDYDMVSMQIIDSVDKEIIHKILAGESVAELRSLRLLNTTIVLCGAPIYDLSEADGTKISGAVILCRPLEDIWGSAAKTVLIFGVAGCIAVLLSLIVAWFLSRRFARPVLMLTSAARRISDGDYGITAEIYETAELNELGSTLNSLSSRLSSVIDSLSNEKSKLEQILRGIGEGIIAVDLSGQVIHHNAAAQDLTGLSPIHLHDARELIGEISTLTERSMEEKERFSTGWSLEDGRRIAANISPVFDDAGENTVGAVVLMRDVSESTRLEQMRRDYIANISHELRTPLTGIRGMVEPLIDGVIEDEAEKQNCYSIIFHETIRLQKLISDMLDMSRLQDGRVEIALEQMDIAAICANICMRMHARSVDTGVMLSTELEEESMYGIGNEDRIIQVLVILLDNAFSFTPSGGSISVFCRRDGGKIAFGVKDSGSGIDPKDLPYIWERFFKADRSRMRTSGTGLGLAIAKLAIEHMGGTVSVESTPGIGSTFTVCLPSAEE